MRPHSFREILPRTASEVRWLFQGSVTTPDISPVRVTGFVTPRMVRSPTIVRSSRLPETFVERKVRVGWFATSKKSGDLRCASRWSLLVEMLSAAISMESAVGIPVSSVAPVAVKERKAPFTVEMAMCLTENSTTAWEGSMVQSMGGSSEELNDR